jgi:hypothetical protein
LLGCLDAIPEPAEHGNDIGRRLDYKMTADTHRVDHAHVGLDRIRLSDAPRPPVALHTCNDERGRRVTVQPRERELRRPR